MKFVFLVFLFLCAGLRLSQPAGQTQSTSPKAAKASPDSASQPQARQADDEKTASAASSVLFPAVVARVNSKPIAGLELERFVRRQLSPIGNPEWKNLREDYRNQLVAEGLASLINSMLLNEKATASGLKATDAEVQAELKKISENFQSDAEMNIALADELTDRATLEKDLYESLALAKYVEENITKKIVVTPEEVTKYYSSNPAEFQHADIVRTSHIIIQPAGNAPEQDALARQRAEALLARIKKGEDFARLAKENSMDSSASKGGDIGYATRTALTPEYGEAAFSLPVGGVKLVKAQAGYHIIKVTDKKKEGLYTLEEVRQQLTDLLKSQKAQAELAKLVNELRDQAKIEILIRSGQPLNP